MYQEMLKIAQNLATQKQTSGQVTPNDTICVVQAVSKQFYTGVSHMEMQNGMMIAVHAEIDAIQQMRAGGDTVAESILLVGAVTLQPILPCGGCINFILSQAPENANCQVVLPDRAIPLSQMVQNQMPAGNVSMYANASPYAGNPGAVSMYGNANPYANNGGAVSMYGNANPYGNPYTNSAGAVSMYNNATPYSGSYMSSMARHKKSSGNKLRDKVSGLANAGKNIDTDDEPENELFSKLFKK